MKNPTRILFAAILVALSVPAFAEQFRYTYQKGDQYRILSTVQEDVYVNRRFSHHAEILNRIAVTVTGAENGGGSLDATFQTSEQSEGASGRSFQWSREYQSLFSRDARGRLSVGETYWMPTVRDVPVMSDRDIKVGDSWSEPGEEVHDFRDGFGIAEPYRIPFTATYRYTGEEAKDGKSYAVFTVSYRIFDEPKAPAPGASFYPTRIMGSSDQKILWDRALGQPWAYEERFRMIFELSNGAIFEYRGTASAKVIEAVAMDREKVAKEIAGEIAKQGIKDTEVRVTDEGVAISMENIQFEADSSVLLPPEKAKLDRLSSILKQYAERDILVAGHTALAGTEEARQKLSGERAGAVAGYLLKAGTRKPEQVVVRGFGATRPQGDNATEEGRRRNRRVEIILLEN